MRIALLQAGGLFGSEIAEDLIERGRDEVLMVVPATRRLDDTASQSALGAAHRRGCPVLRSRSLRDRDVRDRIAAHRPDLIVVATYPQRVPDELRRLPRLDAVNIHQALLPALRGAAPVFWALRRGHERTGVTVHRMTEEFDAGDVLLQESLSIGSGDNWVTVSARQAELGWQLLRELLHRHERGAPPAPVPQDETRATEAPRITRDDLTIRWTDDAADIERLLRAAYGAYRPRAFLDGVRVTPFSARVCDRDDRAAPGTLRLDPERRRAFVATGRGWLELDHLLVRDEPEPAFERLTDLGARDGDRFDPARR